MRDLFVPARGAVSYHPNQLFSVFSLADIAGCSNHLDALALQQCHSLVHVGLLPAAHNYSSPSFSESLSRSQTDSEEGERSTKAPMISAQSFIY